ncbi:hypothetical protein CK203_035735 [Vitis vinifera]|uniref:Uncharacterized protein n=1 Tax=Vitis vinifera TaxID=29760 RepID=A0A438ICP5_VITVI|nr:hypothetical protein CK203_035735 [Vitis vinifera]
MADKTIGGCVRTPRPDAFCRDARPQHWRRLWEIFTDSVTSKDGHTSRSRSSGRGEEDNSEWRQAIERRQLASERQLKALLQETERLREENAYYASRLQHQGLLVVSVQEAK